MEPVALGNLIHQKLLLHATGAEHDMTEWLMKQPEYNPSYWSGCFQSHFSRIPWKVRWNAHWISIFHHSHPKDRTKSMGNPWEIPCSWHFRWHFPTPPGHHPLWIPRSVLTVAGKRYGLRQMVGQVCWSVAKSVRGRDEMAGGEGFHGVL